MESAIGTVILGRWELKKPLGSGLGGETWLADGPDGPVALKILRKENAFFGGFSSLLREALLLRSITHAHLVRYRGVHDLESEGVAILVMDYAEGGDLAAHLHRRGPYSPPEAAALGLQLVTALNALHRARVIHRDLKPGNILVASERGPLPHLLVADFGISRSMVDGVAQATFAAGTPGFAPPEQFHNTYFTPATDIYALGAVLWFLVTGDCPGACNAEATLGQGLLEHLTPSTPGARALAELLPRVMALHPADRCELEEIAAVLATISSGPEQEPSECPTLIHYPDLGDERRGVSATLAPAPTESRRPSVHPTLRAVTQEPRFALRGLLASVVSGAVFAFSATGVHWWLQRHGPAEARFGGREADLTEAPIAAPPDEPANPEELLVEAKEIEPAPAAPPAPIKLVTAKAEPPTPSKDPRRKSRSTEALEQATASLVVDAGAGWAQVALDGEGVQRTGRTGGSLKPWLIEDIPTGTYTLTWSDCQDGACIEKHRERVSLVSELVRRCWDLERRQRCD